LVHQSQSHQAQSHLDLDASTSDVNLGVEQLPDRASFVQNLQGSEKYALRYMKIEGGMGGLFAVDSKVLKEYLKRLPGLTSVLDATAGLGRHVQEIASFYEQRGVLDQVRIVGNDFNPHMVALARDGLTQQLGERMKKVELTNDDVRELSSHLDNSYDLVISLFGSIGMIPDHAQRLRAVAEFARVLKPGGTLLVHAHNFLGNFGIPDRFPEATVQSIRDSSPYLPHGEIVAAADYLARARSSGCSPEIPGFVEPSPRFKEGYELGDMIYQSEIGSQLQHVFLPDELAELLETPGLKVSRRIFLCNRQSEIHPSQEIPELLGSLSRRVFEKYPELFSEGMIFVATKPCIASQSTT
jgi:SAM-dependent methyltransferase